MPEPVERIDTERLALRCITADDIDRLVELNSDPAVMRYINGGKPLTVAEVTDTVHEHMGHRWAASVRSTNEFIGWFALVPTGADERELGYRMRRTAWGNGYATEGTKALIDVAFTEQAAERVWAQTMTVNTRSRAVMERCGLRFVRTFIGDWGPKFDGSEHGDVEYEMTRAEWERSRV